MTNPYSILKHLQIYKVALIDGKFFFLRNVIHATLLGISWYFYGVSMDTLYSQFVLNYHDKHQLELRIPDFELRNSTLLVILT